MTTTMFDTLVRLQEITDGCREDLHEPDEQGISATVVGDHLDNAMGDAAFPHNCGEFVVTLRRGDREERFNLATLIALARMVPDPARTFTVARAVGVFPSVLSIAPSLDGTPVCGDARYLADAQTIVSVLTNYLPSGTFRELLVRLQAQDEAAHR